MKKLLTAAIAASLTSLFLAGCGGGSKTGSANLATENDSSQTEVAKQADGKQDTAMGDLVTLRFSWWGGDSRHKATLACIDAYMKENPNIKIEAEYGGFDGYQDKISAALAGGTEADIMQLDQPWMSTFTSQNPDFFADLTQFGDQLSLEGFSKDFLNDFCVYNGKTVCLPTGTNALDFLVNKKVLEEAGVEFGNVITWEDLVEQGKKVNQANPDNYMINMDNGITFYVTRIYLYQMTGKQVINEDYTLGITAEDLEKAMTYTKRLFDEKVIVPYEESMIFKGAPQDNPKWNNEQFGSWLNWSSTADQQSWGANAETLRYPTLEGCVNSGVLVRPSQLFAISNNSKHKEEAAKFLDYMLNQDAGILTLKDCRSIPACDYARSLLEEKGLIYEPASKAIAFAMENPGTPESNVTNSDEVYDALASIIEKLVYGQYPDAKAAADDAYQTMSNMLETIKADAQ